MPSSCSVIGCKSRGYINGRKFFSFPRLKRSSPKTLALTQSRQNAWFVALNRADFGVSKVKCAKVCDLHFVSGRSAHYTDTTNPDWVPTKNLGYEISEKALAEALKKAMNVAPNKQPNDVPVHGSDIACKETETSATTNGQSRLFSALNMSTRCRMCLEECKELKSMLIPWNNTINLWNMYDYIMNVGDNLDSEFVPHICMKCEGDLKSAFFFKSMCSETEKTLSENQFDDTEFEQSEDDFVTHHLDVEIVEVCDTNDGESEIEDNRTVDNLEMDIAEGCDPNDENFWSDKNVNQIAVMKETGIEHNKPEVLGRKCKACNVQFENRNAYMVHYRKVHYGPLKKTSVSKILCSYCGKLLPQHSMGRHIKNTHHKLIHEKRYECSICGTKFTKNSNLNRHTRQQHAK